MRTNQPKSWFILTTVAAAMTLVHIEQQSIFGKSSDSGAPSKQALEEAAAAKQRFRLMKKTLLGAKTLRCKFTAKNGPFVRNGVFIASEPNNARLDEVSKVDGVVVQSVTMIHDGKRFALFDNTSDFKKVVTWEDPSLRRFFVLSLTGQGLGLAISVQGPETQKIVVRDLDRLFEAYDFRKGKDEPIGKTVAKTIHFRMKPVFLFVNLRSIVDYDVTLWLDAATNLPLKRVVRPRSTEKILPVTEYYSWVIDGMVNPKRFEMKNGSKDKR